MKQINHTLISHPLLGKINVEPLNVAQHITTISHWMHMDYASFWGMKGMADVKIKDNYQTLMNSTSEMAYIGSIEGEIKFLIEVYDVNHHEIGKHFQPLTGDIGMHILLAPANIQQSGFSKAVMEVVLDFIFTQLNAERVVVEPDVNNDKIHRLNQRLGIRHQRKITLSNKEALLGFVTQKQFEQAKNVNHALHNSKQISDGCDKAIAYTKQLSLENWQRVNLELVIKIITEFSHERLIFPEKTTDGCYYLTTENKQITYRFEAQMLPLNHLAINATSLTKTDQNVPATNVSDNIEAMSFIIEFAHQLNLLGEKLATYLEEVSSTLTSSCYKIAKSSYSATELATQAFQVIESEMTHGHPSFVANNGRIGFSSDDYHQFAPEAANTLQLIWLACHRSNTAFHSIEGLSYQALINQELDLSEQLFFEKQLINKGVEPKDYILFPMHPWQWKNKLVLLYAKEIAHQQIICLGQGNDNYLPQQSIRTLFNLSDNSKFYVKTALSILNMGFMRGLSAKYMAVTPAINQWVFELVSQDQTLKALNFVPLQELATVGFSGSYYENEQLGDTPYKKMLAALWRENPTNMIGKNESLATMASLLHLDNNGEAYITANIQAAKIEASEWLSCYFKAYLTPLLHCFYQYKLGSVP
ncbi:MAG: GNAT family N-acetyltransferase [Alteromonadaceae bacterium]|nr:GNAT family N-acetyltransferase [Alteromonadaceae bacterium]